MHLTKSALQIISYCLALIPIATGAIGLLGDRRSALCRRLAQRAARYELAFFRRLLARDGTWRCFGPLEGSRPRRRCSGRFGPRYSWAELAESSQCSPSPYPQPRSSPSRSWSLPARLSLFGGKLKSPGLERILYSGKKPYRAIGPAQRHVTAAKVKPAPKAPRFLPPTIVVSFISQVAYAPVELL